MKVLTNNDNHDSLTEIYRQTDRLTITELTKQFDTNRSEKRTDWRTDQLDENSIRCSV